MVTLDLNQDDAMSILTRLQNGVPPEPNDVLHIRVGRRAEEERICEKVTEGLPSVANGSGQIFFVLGDFGYGKSFFINLIAQRASQRNFVRSEFDIQDIEDLSNKGDLYTGIVRNIKYPDKQGNGLAPLLVEFCKQIDRSEFDAIASRRGMLGHPMYEMLNNLLEAWDKGRVYIKRDDETLEAREVLSGTAGYLSGQEVGLAQKHAIGKKGVGTIDSKETDKLYDYLRHIRSIALELGYEGFAILIDEAAEQLEWSEDTQTTQRLIDLFNRCYKNDQFEHMMFVFVGNEEKWDSLIDMTGHQALSDRYEAKRVVLGDLEYDDYVELVQRVARIVEIAYDTAIVFTNDDAMNLVDVAADIHGGIEGLSPRSLLVFPEGRDQKRTLVDLIDEEYR